MFLDKIFSFSIFQNSHTMNILGKIFGFYIFQNSTLTIPISDLDTYVYKMIHEYIHIIMTGYFKALMMVFNILRST